MINFDKGLKPWQHCSLKSVRENAPKLGSLCCFLTAEAVKKQCLSINSYLCIIYLVLLPTYRRVHGEKTDPEVFCMILQMFPRYNTSKVFQCKEWPCELVNPSRPLLTCLVESHQLTGHFLLQNTGISVIVRT